VPPYQQSRHWADLQALQGPDALQCQLVLHSSAVIRVLSQFERPEFIHTFVDARSSSSNSDGGSWTMLFDLPRFALEFELRGDGLWSRDFAGCRLHACQRLTQANPRGLAAASGSSCIYTLPDFGQYLVLEQAGPLHAGSAGQQRGQLQILVPAGRVQRGSQAVTIQLPTEKCGALLKVTTVLCGSTWVATCNTSAVDNLACTFIMHHIAFCNLLTVPVPSSSLNAAPQVRGASAPGTPAQRLHPSSHAAGGSLCRHKLTPA
jgi:hypothetical protein